MFVIDGAILKASTFLLILLLLFFAFCFSFSFPFALGSSFYSSFYLSLFSFLSFYPSFAGAPIAFVHDILAKLRNHACYWTLGYLGSVMPSVLRVSGQPNLHSLVCPWCQWRRRYICSKKSTDVVGHSGPTLFVSDPIVALSIFQAPLHASTSFFLSCIRALELFTHSRTPVQFLPGSLFWTAYGLFRGWLGAQMTP